MSADQEVIRRSAAEKLLCVIDALADSAPRASLREIALRSQLSKPNAHALLKAMVRHEYARAEPNGVYGPGRQLLAVAGRVLETTDLAVHARAPLLALHDVVPETVHLAILSGLELFYADKLEARGAYRMASRVGARLPFHCTAIGKAVLAQLDPQDRERILRIDGLPLRTSHTITDRHVLDLALGVIASAGYAVDNEENEAGVTCVGAPILGARGAVVGGISVSAPSFSLPEQRVRDLAPHVIAAAADVSAALGCPLLIVERCRDRVDAAHRSSRSGRANSPEFTRQSTAEEEMATDDTVR